MSQVPQCAFLKYRILESLYVAASNYGIKNCFGQGSEDSEIPMGRHGWSVLHTACAYNQLEAVKKIIALTDETAPHHVAVKGEQTRRVLNKNYAFDIVTNDVKELISAETCHAGSGNSIWPNSQMV